MSDRRKERLEARIKASFEADVATFGRLMRDAYVGAVDALGDKSGFLSPLCWEDVPKFFLVIEEEGRVEARWSAVPVGGSVWSRTVRCGRWSPLPPLPMHMRAGPPAGGFGHVTIEGGQAVEGSGGDVTITAGQGASTGSGGHVSIVAGSPGQGGGSVGSPLPLDSEHLLLVAGWDRLTGPALEDEPPSHRWAVAWTTWSGRALAAFMTAREDHDSPVSVGLVEIDYARRDTGPFHGADDLWDAALSRGSWRRPLRGEGWVVLPSVPWKVLMGFATESGVEDL